MLESDTPEDDEEDDEDSQQPVEEGDDEEADLAGAIMLVAISKKSQPEVTLVMLSSLF